VCHQSTRWRRQVDPAVHRLAYVEYSYAVPQSPGRFEVDHLIPLELGGDDTIENLWPPPASPTPGFHEKHLTENYLHERVCFGRMQLELAQRAIARDWLGGWRVLSAGLKPKCGNSFGLRVDWRRKGERSRTCFAGARRASELVCLRQ
jgi:hypothetical protein